MKHVHHDKIVAKAANVDLVVFQIDPNGKNKVWSEYYCEEDGDFPLFYQNCNYFLCLPQHKEAVLNSLNGGIAQFESPREKGDHALEQADWSNSEWYMQGDATSRIKPKKEKRWIAVNPDGYVLPIHADSKESIRAHASNDTSRLTLGVQFIQIEVEV